MTNVEVAGGALFLDPNPRPPRAPGTHHIFLPFPATSGVATK